MNPRQSISTSTRPGKCDVVCISHLRWGFVFQRPQHLLTRCAQDRRVFYVEEPVFDSPVPRLETRLEGAVTVCVPHLPEGRTAQEIADGQAALLDHLIERNEIDRFVLWFYTPMAVPFTRHLRPTATVYDCMDELSAFAGAPKELRDREGELFDSADLVFTGGRSLYESKRQRHGRVHLFPSSVDVEHFRTARDATPDPTDQVSIPHPRVGFYGVIDERTDLDLIAEIARSRPAWSFVILGPVVKIDPETLPQAPNIHYLGAKAYGDLPRYASGWDVAMMPFARNESTRFISPTKTPEFLAAGLPVVSTSVPDVVAAYQPRGLVRIADDPESFVAAIEEALREDPGARLDAVEEILRSDSWDETWRKMRELIEEVTGNSARRTLTHRNGGRINGGITRERRDNRIDGASAHAKRIVSVDGEGTPAGGFDYLIVGAGFAGAVLAERLAADAGKRVLIVEKRNHIGGNAYDHHDDAGLLVHKYGPHIFHTNSADVFRYLSRFTDWRPYQHRVRACVNGALLPIPINVDTINELYGMSLTARDVERFFDSVGEPIDPVRTSEDVVVRRVGRELYELFFRNYTRKQWGLDPSELDASVTARVPVRSNRDDRYFTDRYQSMPRRGYTRMFERMLVHPNIKVMLNTSYREVVTMIPHHEVIFTGPIDEFFDFKLGRLPYRSLEFSFETHDVEWFQPAPVVNYPNEYDYTRITEFKYLTGQVHPKTSLVYEYPRAEGDPYYPVPRPENAALYRRYKEMAEAVGGVHFVGRLATYKYYNMDQVVAQALAVYRRIAGKTPNDVATKDDLDGAISPAARGLGGRRVHAQPRS